MFQNFIPPSQRAWVTTSIAWLSVCIIAAAWGKRLLPNESQDVWGLIGIFGLASALGLASIAKLRRDAADKLARSQEGASSIDLLAVARRVSAYSRTLLRVQLDEQGRASRCELPK